MASPSSSSSSVSSTSVVSAAAYTPPGGATPSKKLHQMVLARHETVHRSVVKQITSDVFERMMFAMVEEGAEETDQDREYAFLNSDQEDVQQEEDEDDDEEVADETGSMGSAAQVVDSYVFAKRDRIRRSAVHWGLGEEMASNNLCNFCHAAVEDGVCLFDCQDGDFKPGHQAKVDYFCDRTCLRRYLLCLIPDENITVPGTYSTLPSSS